MDITIKDEERDFVRLCPRCSERITYKSKYTKRDADKFGIVCKQCRDNDKRGVNQPRTIQEKVGKIPNYYDLRVLPVTVRTNFK